MKKYIVALAIAGFLSGTALATSAFAQDEGVGGGPGHPRVNEVNQRLDNQQNRIDNGLKDGQMTTGEAKRDEARDAKVERQEARDEAKNGGHLTRREQRHMNHELNHNSRDIHRQRHHGEERRRARHERHERHHHHHA
jgi:hypothetical protein